MYSAYQEREEYEDELYKDEDGSSSSEVDSELEFRLYSQLHYCGSSGQQENRNGLEGNQDELEGNRNGLEGNRNGQQGNRNRLAENRKGLEGNRKGQQENRKGLDENRKGQQESRKGQQENRKGQQVVIVIDSGPEVVTLSDSTEDEGVCVSKGLKTWPPGSVHGRCLSLQSPPREVSAERSLGGTACENSVITLGSDSDLTLDSDSDDLENWMILGQNKLEGDCRIQLNLEGMGNSSPSEDGDDTNQIWTISKRDMMAQISNRRPGGRYTTSRYYTVKTVTCHSCNKLGHLSKKLSAAQAPILLAVWQSGPHPAELSAPTLCQLWPAWSRQRRLCGACLLDQAVLPLCNARAFPRRVPRDLETVPRHDEDRPSSKARQRSPPQESSILLQLLPQRPFWLRECHFSATLPQVYLWLSCPALPHDTQSFHRSVLGCILTLCLWQECNERRMFNGTYPTAPYIYYYDKEKDICRRDKRMAKKVQDLQEAGLLVQTHPDQTLTVGGEDENQPRKKRQLTKEWVRKQHKDKKASPQVQSEQKEAGLQKKTGKRHHLLSKPWQQKRKERRQQKKQRRERATQQPAALRDPEDFPRGPKKTTGTPRSAHKGKGTPGLFDHANKGLKGKRRRPRGRDRKPENLYPTDENLFLIKQRRTK